MIEIGTDLVLVSRMEKSLQIPGFAEKVFSEPERAYCKTTESFAGIFAAYYTAKAPRILKGVLDVVLTLPLVLPPTVVGYLLLRLMGKAVF